MSAQELCRAEIVQPSFNKNDSVVCRATRGYASYTTGNPILDGPQEVFSLNSKWQFEEKKLRGAGICQPYLEPDFFP